MTRFVSHFKLSPVRRGTYRTISLDRLLTTAAAVLAILIGPQAFGQYTIAEVKRPRGFNVIQVTRNSLNNHGQVASTATSNESGRQRSVISQGSSARLLPDPPGADYSGGWSMNDREQVTGIIGSFVEGSVSAVLWSHNHPMLLPTPDGMWLAAPEGLNNQGDIAVTTADFDYNLFAYRWHSGSLSRLPSPDGSLSDIAWGIGSDGTVVGESYIGDYDETFARPVHWTQAGAEILPMLHGYGGAAFSINANGLIVGAVMHAPFSFYRATLWDNGNAIELQPLGGAILFDQFVAYPCAALAVNGHGDVVGWAWTGLPWMPGSQLRPVLWRNGSILDLTTTIPANSGWQLYAAMAINDAGVIVGNGQHDGRDAVYMLTPTNH